MKDTFYFSHDYNARSDDKIKLLIRKHGMIGYGVFWAIVEDLYNNANALRLDCEGIAYDLHVDVKIIESIIFDYELFVIENNFFGSLSVERRLNERNEKSEKARKSALNRWNKTKDDANAMRTQCEGYAIKERKGKEIKERIYIDLGQEIQENSTKTESEILKERFNTYKQYLANHDVRYSLGAILKADPKPLNTLIEYFFITKAEVIAEKETKYQAKDFFQNWAKKEPNRVEALNNYQRLIKPKQSTE